MEGKYKYKDQEKFGWCSRILMSLKKLLIHWIINILGKREFIWVMPQIDAIKLCSNDYYLFRILILNLRTKN
jgi:hypothetical protein